MGSHVDLKETPAGLKIELLPEGRAWLQTERTADGWKRGTKFIFQDMLEDWFGCGWEWVLPEDIGALTSAPILRSPDGAIYWFPEYAVQCELEEMLSQGFVMFTKVKEDAA